MTNPTESPSLPSPFSSLASRLSAWRSAGRPGRRIPEPFWEEAAARAKVHGLSPTSTILKLTDQSLAESTLLAPKKDLTNAGFALILVRSSSTRFSNDSFCFNGFLETPFFFMCAQTNSSGFKSGA